MAKTLRVAIENAAYSYDKLYDYLPPEGQELRPGMRVLVPFGKGGDRMGLIVEEGEMEPERLKTILRAADSEPVLDEEQLVLLRWLKESSFCRWFDALRVLIPAGYGQKLRRGYLYAGREPDDSMPLELKTLADWFRHKRKPVAPEEIPEPWAENSAALVEELLKGGVLKEAELIERRVQDQTLQMVRLKDCWEDCAMTPRQRKTAELLAEQGEASVRELCYFSGCTKGVVDKLVACGAAEYYEEEAFRDPYADVPRQQEPLPELSAEQADVLEALWAEYQKGEGSAALLHGVTGSGKTLVFLHLIQRVLAAGKRAIVLVPEISLTPQTIRRFHSLCGERAAVLHSGLSMSERLDEWKRVRKGLADVVVGTRSAVFAPMPDLGLIVIDEEQEATYKSESAPRFDAREAARVRMKYHRGLLLLASATPSLESYYRARKGEILLTELKGRYGAARLPQVTILDLHTDQTIGGDGLSGDLCRELIANLERGEQSILLMNRRGHSTEVTCMSCHQPARCPNCSISLKFHAANQRLMCHYCGYSIPVPKTCPECGSEYIRYSGTGTQKIEEELHSRFPGARVLRMDLDTTMRKFSHQKLLSQFRNGEYDIMVGTQMVAKGLDFPKVTLVGVLGIDQMLYGGDFRSYERVFSMITQVVGRCGRGELPGRAVLQTYTPENPILSLAAAQDYQSFYREEIQNRKLLLYPPFCRMYCIGFSGRNPKELNLFARSVQEELTRLLREKYPELPIRLLGLSEGTVFRVAGKYRYKILVKGKNSPRTRALFAELLNWADKKAPREVSVFVDPEYDTGF